MTSVSFARLDTSDAAGANQFAQWESWVSELHGRLSFDRRSGSAYDGRLNVLRSGDLQLIRFFGERAALRRTREHVRLDQTCHYEIVVPLSGAVTIGNGQGNCVLHPGQFMLVDSARPLLFEHDMAVSAITLSIARKALEHRLPDLDDAAGRGFGGRHPLAAPALAYIASLTESMATLDGPSFVQAGRHLVELFALIIEGEADRRSDQSAVQAAILRRIKQFIRAELANDQLNLPLIAGAAGISTRYVQTLFKAAGTTATDYIREARLLRALDMLSDPGQRRISVTQIALAAGFSNPSHFSAAFRQRFGCTPRECRH